jgi:hypothetical protein
MNFSIETKEKIPFGLFLLKKPKLNNTSAILKDKRDKEMELRLRVKINLNIKFYIF